jgi:hypothetical protein
MAWKQHVPHSPEFQRFPCLWTRLSLVCCYAERVNGVPPADSLPNSDRVVGHSRLSSPPPPNAVAGEYLVFQSPAGSANPEVHESPVDLLCVKDAMLGLSC